MPKPYSLDLRERVIEAVVAGASRREVAEQYQLSPSVVVIWMQRWEATGSIAAKPSGGSISPLEDHAEFLLDLVAEQPDLTLDEIVAAMAKAGIPGSRTAVWRFFERHEVSFKKTLYASEQNRADVARARRRWIRQQRLLDTTALVFLDETAITTSMVRTRGRCPRGDRLVDYAPHGHWKTVTFIAGLRHDKMVAPFVIEGAMNGDTFLAYIEQFLVPTLQPDDIVVMDNVSTHKVNGVAEAIEMVGTQSWCSARSSNSTPVMSVSTGVRSAAGQFGSPKTRLLFNTAPSRSFRRDRPRDLVSGGTMGASFGSLGAW